MTKKAKKPSMKKPSAKLMKGIVKLSYGMSGKMYNVLSLSTNCVNCPRCIQRHKNPNSICYDCYAMKQLEKPNYKNTNMIKAFNHNADALTTKVLSDAECMDIAKEIVFALIKNETHLLRIESFGDLHNEIHAMNYINICAAVDFVSFEENYKVKIGFWTKNFDYLCNAFQKCNEFTKTSFRHSTSVVLSSVFKNIKISDCIVEKVEKILGMRVKTFTVMTENSDIINCGKRACATCEKCYTKDNEIYNMFEYIK